MNGLYITIPFFGTTSVLALIVSPLCVTFATVWAVYRHTSFAWVAQDILVSISPLPPNIMLLTCMYAQNMLS